MHSSQTRGGPVETETWLQPDWVAALLLFLATAAVVVWQNSRLGVLWDLSYILENSYRISLGDIPYRDFPLPYAPLAFLMQAALIKLTGRVFFHHVLYCAAAGGLATVLAWQILLNSLRGTVASARLVAILLSAPLAVLGIYCIYPHPFYDPDCTLAILVGIVLLRKAESRGFPPPRALLAGASLVIPAFVKQNTGLAFLVCAVLSLAVLMAFEARRWQAVRGYAWVVAGVAAGLTAALLLIHFTAGLANYWHWTVRFAAARRLPRFTELLAVYRNALLPWWLAAFASGGLLLWLNPRGKRMFAGLGVSLMSLPFAWTVVSLWQETDASERAEWLLALWPFVIVVSLGLAALAFPRRAGLSRVLPFVLIGTLQGAFLSQQLWGSTYALWPLFMFLIADAITAGVALAGEKPRWVLMPFACVAGVSLLIAGGSYASSRERLEYANVSEGEIARPTLPALTGLSVHGDWIPQFEEVVRFAEREIPREDGLLMIPGEDLFYYATGRRPRFPVLMFDRTVNPYSPEELLQLSRERGIRWLVVKRDLQLAEDPVEDKAWLLELLRQDFEQVETLDNYDVYGRKPTGASIGKPKARSATRRTAYNSRAPLPNAGRRTDF